MSKLSNALRMIEILHSNGKTKIAELSNLLEVNERMVRNYRAELIKADIMIDSDRGPDGGHSLNRNSFLHIRNITSEELEALKLSGESSKQSPPSLMAAFILKQQ
ncbi:helix-turn-helix transcriptional regulator [Ectobacillus sp. sgz5001026]|uniref:helix-turn-helix transcriptional regulator n=1 Tax=Ectobacillus sp. sgz5001026 TaxID=3242473 RepID=UPI0036D242BF